MFKIPFPQSSLILNEHSSFFLEMKPEGLTVFSDSALPLFEINEPILLAQGISEGTHQIHLAYLKATGELCYSILSDTGAQHTTTLGKLDTQVNRYDRLILIPVDKVIHIFYAASHLALPDVWRITHLLWNGQTWRSAQLGEVVHPRHPLYHVLVDSKLNLHVLMMTFLGNHSVLLTSFFNGTFHIWSNRQESLSIPREVIDMTALITSSNQGYVFWAAKQPGSDQLEVSYAIQPRIQDFTSSWQIESSSITHIAGPWRGLGVLSSGGSFNLLINTDRERLFQFNNRTWSLTSTSSTPHSPLWVIQRSESLINYTNWLKNNESNTPLFSEEVHLTLPQSSPFTPPAPSTSSSEPGEIPLEATPSSDPILTPELTSEAPSLQPELPSVPTESPSESLIEKKDFTAILVSLIRGLSESTSSLTNNLQDVGETMASIPEVLQALIKKNEETLESLRSLEGKINEINAQREIATKKGFWERWFT